MTGRDRLGALIHYNAAFIGGILGIHAILVRLTFGSSQTMNLLSLVSDVLGRNIPDFLARLGALLLYVAGVALSVIISDRKARGGNIIAFSIDAVSCVILAFFPAEMNHIVALYPIFFAAAFQWCTVKGPYGYASASIFSTNNVRQFVTGLIHKAEGKDTAEVSRMHAFGMTLLVFHLGAVYEYMLLSLFGIPGILGGLVPAASALALSIIEIRDRA